MTWSMKGTYFESCNCEAACPCIFLSAPSHGDCTVLVGWHIEEGDDEGVSLDGMNMALAVHSPGHMATTPWKAAVYVDARASEEQNASLMKIFGGQAGGHPARLAQHIGEIVGVRAAPITFTVDGGRHSLVIPGIADVEIAPIDGQAGGPVTVEGHPLAIAPGQAATVARSTRLSYCDHGMEWNLSERTGQFSPFEYRSEQ